MARNEIGKRPAITCVARQHKRVHASPPQAALLSRAIAMQSIECAVQQKLIQINQFSEYQLLKQGDRF
ncbi:MAG: hypothetical protein NTX56_15045 [Proteobacteria bacterium]|nr:hypothetical protein [Pseudomonadota bacterium]